ncbi:hypothetical protein P7C70_g4818, partial [Phenoliferia sp. Uapishka_3]
MLSLLGLSIVIPIMKSAGKRSNKRGPSPPNSPPATRRSRSDEGASRGWALPPAARTSRIIATQTIQASTPDRTLTNLFLQQGLITEARLSAHPVDTTPSIFPRATPYQPTPQHTFPFHKLPPDLQISVLKSYAESRTDPDSRNVRSDEHHKDQNKVLTAPAAAWEWMEPLFLVNRAFQVVAEEIFYGKLEVYWDQLEGLVRKLVRDATSKRPIPHGWLVFSLLVHARYEELQPGSTVTGHYPPPANDINLGYLRTIIASMPRLALLHVRGSRAEHFFSTTILPLYQPPTHNVLRPRGIHLIFEVAHTLPQLKDDTLPLGQLRRYLGGTVVEKLTMGPFSKAVDPAAQKPPQGACFPLLQELALDVAPSVDVFRFLEKMVRGEHCEGPALEIIRLADRNPVTTHIDKVAAYKESLEGLAQSEWQTEKWIGGVLRQVPVLKIQIVKRGRHLV